MWQYFCIKKPEKFGLLVRSREFGDLVAEDAFTLAEPLDVGDEAAHDLFERHQAFDHHAAERAVAHLERQAVEAPFLLVTFVREVDELALHRGEGDGGCVGQFQSPGLCECTVPHRSAIYKIHTFIFFVN